MKSVWEHNLKLEIYGQSHGAAVGFYLYNFPSGVTLDCGMINAFMRRRSPAGEFGSRRRETDEYEFLSGVATDGNDFITTGDVIHAEIANRDADSSVYRVLQGIPRPGHADLPLYLKYSADYDISGGGHHSGRLTAPLTLAGALCVSMLQERGIHIGAHIYSAAGIRDTAFDPVTVTKKTLDALKDADFPTIDLFAGEKIKQSLSALRAQGKACGAVIQCCIIGCCEVLGNHMFYGLENVISSLAFAVPAVKGIDFGDGFALAEETSPQSNDEYTLEDGKITSSTNHAGGILGGMTYGMPVLFRVAIKPTPSVSSPQRSVDMKTNTETEISVSGRHDVCIGVRAVPVIEAVAAIAVADLIAGVIAGGGR